jgi:hypothetical protein
MPPIGDIIAIVITMVIIFGYLIHVARKNRDEPGVAMLVTNEGLLTCPDCRSQGFTIKDNKLMCYSCKTLYESYGIFGLRKYKKMDMHNPFGLKPGDKVYVDEYDLAVGTVEITKISPRGIYAEVKDGDSKWEVMTCRLVLPKFYCTFGQAHILRGVRLKDGWVEISAKTIKDAQEHIREYVDNMYSSIYNDIDRDFYPQGCLARMVVPY